MCNLIKHNTMQKFIYIVGNTRVFLHMYRNTLEILVNSIRGNKKKCSSIYRMILFSLAEAITLSEKSSSGNTVLIQGVECDLVALPFHQVNI